MARNLDAKCRQCRREGEKLFLKGEKCFTDKCAFERRGYAPGEHGKSRRAKETNYGTQLREKQKARRIYGLLERQFRHTFAKASEAKGVTGELLLQMLERRMDNVVFRLGLAASRFPPLRQFGLMTAAAFVLALIADFTMLPAALWITSRARPS